MAPTPGGQFPFARLLFSVPTVGSETKDHSPVLAKLAEQGFSYRTATLDNRVGMPAVIAVDVPSGQQSKLRSVLRAVYKLPGAERIAAFPSVTPMVPESLRPAPSQSPKVRTLVRGGAVIAGAVAVYTGLAYFGLV